MGTPSKATSTKGVKLQRGDGAGSETFTTIGEIKSFDGPSEEAPQLDVSNFDSLAQEFIAGLPSNGQVSGTMNFVGDDAQQQGLRADLRAGTLRHFKLILADSLSTPTTFSFSAIVMSFSISGSTNAILDAKFALKVSGVSSISYNT